MPRDFSETYMRIADLFEDLAKQHNLAARLLEEAADDPNHKTSNETLAEAERVHADSCRRAVEELIFVRRGE